MTYRDKAIEAVARKLSPMLAGVAFGKLRDDLAAELAEAALIAVLAAARLEGARAENEACVWRFANRG